MSTRFTIAVLYSKCLTPYTICESLNSRQTPCCCPTVWYRKMSTPLYHVLAYRGSPCYCAAEEQVCCSVQVTHGNTLGDTRDTIHAGPKLTISTLNTTIVVHPFTHIFTLTIIPIPTVGL